MLGTRFAAILRKAPVPIILIMFLCVTQAHAYRCAYSKPPRAGCFEIIQAEGISEQDHLRIFNHRITVAPDMSDVMGFADPVSPPYITDDFSMRVLFNGKSYSPQEYSWRMYDFDRIIKRPSFAVRSTLTTAPYDPAFLVLGQIYDHKGDGVEVEVEFRMSGKFGRGGEKQWGSEPPEASIETKISFSERTSLLRASTSEGGVYCRVNLEGLEFSDGVLRGKIVLKPFANKIFYMICAIGTEGQALGYLDANSDPEKLSKGMYTAVQVEMMSMYEKIPYIITDNPRLRRFYDKSAVSFQASKWLMKGRFHLYPFYASGGIDGRDMWSGINEFAYASRFMSMADPDGMKKHLAYFIQAALGGKSAIDPFSADSTGPYNAYTNYSVLKLLYDYIAITGDYEFLDSQIGGVRMQDALIKLVEGKSKRLGNPSIMNFGPAENLLSDNDAQYSFFTPSPNAERTWMYRALGELVNVSGDLDHWQKLLNEKAKVLSNLINTRLWNSEASWYDTRDASAVRRTVWSAKVFDLIDTGVPSAWEMNSLVEHLTEKEFLAPKGLNSVTRLSGSQFDEGDTKWGGPGSFTGQAARLVEILYRNGYSTEAEDLLNRILWWGSRFVYYPETVRADTENYDRTGRANTISGLAAAESVIFGMFGLDVGIDGEISFTPGKLTIAKSVNMHKLRIRGHEFQLSLYPDRCEITMDEERLPDLEIGEKTIVVEGHPYVDESDPMPDRCYESRAILNAAKEKAGQE